MKSSARWVWWPEAEFLAGTKSYPCLRSRSKIELREFYMPAVLTSLTEYLTTTYHPDRDYVDGEVQERNLGEFEHAAIQAFLTAWFFQHRQEWQLHVLPEMRLRVSSERVRIPDVCLVIRNQPVEQVLTRPPLAVLEILSPEDRVLRYNERLAAYRQMRIRHV